MRSLSARLTWGVALITVVLMATAGVSLYLIVRAELIRQVDEALLGHARMMTSMVERIPEGLDLGYPEVEDMGGRGGGSWLALCHGESLLHAMWEEPDDEYEDDEEDESEEADDDDDDRQKRLLAERWAKAGLAPGWVTLPTGVTGRTVVYEFTPEWDRPDPAEPLEVAEDDEVVVALPDGAEVLPTLTFWVSGDLAGIEPTLRVLRWGLAGVGLALAVLLPVGSGWVVRRGLSPVRRVSAWVEALDEKSLGRRLEVGEMPAELRPIVSQCHALFSRLAEAFEREQSFSAGVAHELRTPLSGLRSTLEVTMRQPRSDQEYADCLARLMGVVTQMQSMVEGLLCLAALERGQPTAEAETVEIKAMAEVLLDEAVAEYGQTKKIDVSLEGETATVDIDVQLFAMVLRNVLSNAVRYVEDGGRVRAGVKRCDAGAVVRVVNSGSAVSAADAEKVFDRFWRADASRSGDGKHFGLGMALVRQAMAALGGSVTVKSQMGGDFEVQLVVGDSQRGAQG